MTLADVVRQMIEQGIKSAYIVSPRFDDYKIEAVDIFPEDFDQIVESEVKRIMEESREEIESEGGIADGSSTNIKSKKDGSKIDEGARLFGSGLSMARNPAGLINTGVGFLPHAVVIAVALATVPFVIKYISRPGGPLDVRWKRYAEEEDNAFLDRQTQRDTEIGLRQVIVSSKAGMIAKSGAMHEDNLRFIRDGGVNGSRLDRIGPKDHSKLLFGG